jgi:uncharacterized metal-binding protein
MGDIVGLLLLGILLLIISIATIIAFIGEIGLNIRRWDFAEYVASIFIIFLLVVSISYFYASHHNYKAYKQIEVEKYHREEETKKPLN